MTLIKILGIVDKFNIKYWYLYIFLTPLLLYAYWIIVQNNIGYLFKVFDKLIILWMIYGITIISSLLSITKGLRALIVLLFGLFFFIGFYICFNPNDWYFNYLSNNRNEHEEKALTIDSKRTYDSLLSANNNRLDFILINSFQKGIYDCIISVDTIGEGVLYLKVYELNQNIRLSRKDIRKSFRIKVRNTDSTNYEQEIKINEGDWGYPYNARFELWFRQKNSLKKKKLIEKNYEIEGWTF